jgi:hypothetical protein
MNSPYRPQQPQATSPQRSRRTLWIILAVCGGVLLLCCGGLVGLAALGATVKTAAVSKAVPGRTIAPKPAATVPRMTSTPSTTPPTTFAPAPPTTPAAAPTPASSPVSPHRRICRVTESAGSYYLNVTSAMDHNFQACAGATPYPGTLDDLLNLPGMDRRCILGDQYTAQNHALVGVYSDSASPNLTAAREFCTANGGTN